MSVKKFMSYEDAETVLTEFANDIKDNREDISGIDTALFSDDTTTVDYTNVITIPNAPDVHAQSLKVKFAPVQDLHGQANPYPAGGGKNKLPLNLANIKALNTAGTWNGNVYTLNNVTFTVYTDNDGNITLIEVDGTPNATTTFMLTARGAGNAYYVPANNYILNGCPANGSQSTYNMVFQTTRNGSIYNFGYDTGSGLSASVLATDRLQVSITIVNGYNAQNLIFYPMLRLSTVSDATFAPYTNICPISGHTGASAVVLNGTLYKKTSDFEQGAYLTDGSKNDSSEALSIRVRDNTIHMMTAGTYRISCKTTQNKTVQMAYQTWANDTYGDNTRTSDSGWLALGDITLSEDTYFSVGFRYSNNTAISLSDLTISITSASPSDTHTTPFGDTYYSGYVDVVTGELVVDSALIDIGDITWEYDGTNHRFAGSLPTPKQYPTRENPLKCDCFQTIDDGRAIADVPDYAIYGVHPRAYINCSDYTDGNAFKTAYTGHKIWYELATPIRIALTPQLVKLFKGYNTIYSDAGQVRLEYTANLITCLNEDIAKKADNAALAPVEDGATAKRAYTKGQHFMRDGEFCTVLASIASGASFTRGTNYKGGDVGAEFLNFFHVDSPTFTSMDDVPLGFGYATFGSAVCPYGTDAVFSYLCFGFEKRTVILFSTSQAKLYINNKTSTGWSGWKYVAATDV